jgi:hypothetical protein
MAVGSRMSSSRRTTRLHRVAEATGSPRLTSGFRGTARAWSVRFHPGPNRDNTGHQPGADDVVVNRSTILKLGGTKCRGSNVGCPGVSLRWESLQSRRWRGGAGFSCTDRMRNRMGWVGKYLRHGHVHGGHGHLRGMGDVLEHCLAVQLGLPPKRMDPTGVDGIRLLPVPNERGSDGDRPDRPLTHGGIAS